MDLDEDYVPSSLSRGETTEIDSSSSSEGPTYRELLQTQGQTDGPELNLPIRPATSSSEIQQGALGRLDEIGDRTSRKRRRSTQNTHIADPTGLPLKRQRSTLNSGYVEILNQDIKDAAEANISEYWQSLDSSQVGAVSWTSLEKEKFFSGLERLGRLDLAGIASRIGTKSEVEIHQYLKLLEQEDRIRRADLGKRKRAIRPVDIPLAAEITQETCNALEAAADDIALRQERHEETVEQGRWQDHWLITPALATFFERQVRREKNDNLPFAEFLLMRNWLKLSDRVFMNSVIPDHSWQFVSEEPPSMRATAFQDFYSLAVSITRRLVTTTLHIATSRVNAKQAGNHRTRGLIKNKDVRAAAASLGMKENSRGFWARTARRLRLNVYKDESQDENHAETGAVDTAPEIVDVDIDYDDDDEGYAMSYHEVEAALGIDSAPESSDEESDDGSLSDASEDESAQQVADGEQKQDIDSHEDSEDARDQLDEDSDIDQDAVDRDLDEALRPDIDHDIDHSKVDGELHEALNYTDIDDPGTARGRQAIRRRIEMEHRLEVQCVRFDALFDRVEEMRLQRVVQSGGPAKYSDKVTQAIEAQIARQKQEELKWPSQKAGLDDSAHDWKEGLEYYGEWEVQK
ncbi:hypothetical protein DL766_000862 [Monosporascus sp. MC13-8B]|uniref:Myb-like domain-containing protein n=1 Tax=Monosporascus cannonballus TaxID=155416 RepID=A0ABY0GS19_9PEZI|nr:hypothetical protein DL762_010191 [Monosporascus cannonballus]RYO94102.1 hypothetical protein DL763_004170 [Monosporascus cannonballus]RYP38652.1 hypothetical protein DL766_000862 [Monosporascus sp. MC13-8B]